MGYATLIRNYVDQILTKNKLLQDIPVDIIYYSGDPGDLASYDTDTQLMTRNETEGIGVDAVYAEAEEKQIDNVNILKNDKFFYISDLNLVRVGITSVKPNDRIVFQGINETVISAATDPTHSLWTVQTRIP